MRSCWAFSVRTKTRAGKGSLDRSSTASTRWKHVLEAPAQPAGGRRVYVAWFNLRPTSARRGRTMEPPRRNYLRDEEKEYLLESPFIGFEGAVPALPTTAAILLATMLLIRGVQHRTVR